MTFDDAMNMARANPGLGVREASMSPRWKVIYIKFRIKGGDFFCINPKTGSDYLFTPTDAYRASTKWRHI